MKVLMTGATGFIGRHCIPALLDKGHEVCAVSSQSRTSDRIDWRQADLFDAAQIRDVVASVRPTHLLHMAWTTTPGQYWTSLDNVRWLTASLQLLQAFHQYGGTRVVMAGTCAEYDCRIGTCDEATTPLVPDTLYGSCKHALQLLLQAYARQTGLSAAWGRIFFTYGPHEHPARLVPSVIGRLLSGQEAHCSHGTQVRDFLFVEDVAAAFVALLGSDVSGAVNVASGVPLTIRDLVLQIADMLDARALVRLGSRPATPGEPERIVADVGRLRTEVGWHPRHSLCTGLDRTILWWREQLSMGAVTSQVFR